MKCIQFTLLFLVSAFANAQEIDTESLLVKYLGDSIKKQSATEIWYCPDNTCSMYQSASQHKDFMSYVFLKLYHEGEYVYLVESFAGAKPFVKVAVEEPEIRSSMQHYCSSTAINAECILKGMEAELAIEVGAGRYDESSFCYSYNNDKDTCKQL